MAPRVCLRKCLATLDPTTASRRSPSYIAEVARVFYSKHVYACGPSSRALARREGYGLRRHTLFAFEPTGVYFFYLCTLQRYDPDCEKNTSVPVIIRHPDAAMYHSFRAGKGMDS